MRWCCASIFFFSSRRRHTRSLCDWSSDVCSSDLSGGTPVAKAAGWADPDAEARRRGERTGLDTPVVHAVNDADWAWRALTPAVPEPTREVGRLGSTAARLKLKGIDGGPHKRRSVRFNSTQRAEPYPGLTCACRAGKPVGLRGWRTGAAWLSSARVVRGWVKSRNERNPRGQLCDVSGRTAGSKPEEGGDEVKSAWPLRPGRHARYNGQDSGLPRRKPGRIPGSMPQFAMRAATRPHEAGVASNRGSALPR